MWERMPLPYVCERLIAFSTPVDDVFWALSYEGLHRVTLAPEIIVTTDEDHAEDFDIYDTDRGLLTHQGKQHQMLGLYGGTPTHELPSKERLELNELFKMSVTGREGEELADFVDFDLDEDWGFATFSKDGKYIILASPNDLRVYCRST